MALLAPQALAPRGIFRSDEQGSLNSSQWPEPFESWRSEQYQLSGGTPKLMFSLEQITARKKTRLWSFRVSRAGEHRFPSLG